MDAEGKSFSTPVVAYVSTVTSPARVVTSRYLPKLNPANGIGRSEIQCDLCSVPDSCGISPDTMGAGFPVATNVQSVGYLNSKSKFAISKPRFGYQVPRAPT